MSSATLSFAACTVGYVAVLAKMLGVLRRRVRGSFWTHPVTLFVVPFSLYSLSLPVSRYLFRSGAESHDTGFMLHQLIALASFGTFYLVLASLLRNPACPVASDTAQRPHFEILDVSMVVLLVLYVGFIVDRGGWRFLIAPYGSDQELGRSSLLLFLSGTMFSAVAILAASYYPVLGRVRRIAYGLLTAFLAVTFLMAGNRNMMLWLALPILVIAGARARRIRTAAVIAGVVLGYVALQTAGVARNWGVADIDKAAVALDTSFPAFLDPLAGELGTSQNVYKIAYTLGLAGPGSPLLLGRSYFIEPFTNAIPASLWPNRPPTLAQRFSIDYYGELPLGLGLSGVTESLMNFGPAGPALVLAILGGLTALLARFHRGLPRMGARLACYGLFLPAAFNFNRIDFATLVKLTVIRMAVIGLAAFLLRLTAPAPRVSRTPRRAAKPR